jgi:hypothetical protein
MPSSARHPVLLPCTRSAARARLLGPDALYDLLAGGRRPLRRLPSGWGKRLHHLITTGAALLNWHAHTIGAYARMRPGIESHETETRNA